MVATAHRREFARRLAAAAAAYHREEARRRVALPPLADAKLPKAMFPKPLRIASTPLLAHVKLG